MGVGLSGVVNLADLVYPGFITGIGLIVRLVRIDSPVCIVGLGRIARLPLIRVHLRDHGVQRLHQQPALLGGDPPAEHRRLVVLVETIEAFFPPSFGLARRSLRLLAAPAVDPHQPFDVLGGAVAGDVQQL